MNRRVFFVLWLLTWWVLSATAETLTFADRESWSTWRWPAGMVQIDSSGLRLTSFRREIDAIRNASSFSHLTRKAGRVQGGIWWAGSNPEEAELAIDGDATTFWRPDPLDDVLKWVLEVDLGRPVLAQELRLRFAEGGDTRPFRQFSVFVADGERAIDSEDEFRFHQVYRTTLPNERTLVRIAPSYADDAVTRSLGSSGFDEERESLYRVVQYVRVVADEKIVGGALAEVEVIAAGDNLVTNLSARGGSLSSGRLVRKAQDMVDGDMDTYAIVSSEPFRSDLTSGNVRETDMWWQLDLGAVFWVNEIFLGWQKRIFAGASAGTGFAVMASAGGRTFADQPDFEPLLLQGDRQFNGEYNKLEQSKFRYLFKARKIRYLFWHVLDKEGWSSWLKEVMLFAPGYPAEVVLHSDFIDLGEATSEHRKYVRRISYDGDTPPGTRLLLRSRSGDSLRVQYVFRNRRGEPVSQHIWNSWPKVLKGRIDTTLSANDSWDKWSSPYSTSGQSFLSATPRRYLQLELALISEDPQQTPALRWLSIEYSDPLLEDVSGRVLPRSVPVNEETEFRYELWPRPSREDPGFDMLQLKTGMRVFNPRAETATGPPQRVEVQGDSILLFTWPCAIRGDSVTVHFSARVNRYAARIEAAVGNSRFPGLWQEIADSERDAHTLLLPDLPKKTRLLADITVVPMVCTPNADGINDQVHISFVALKVDNPKPKVVITDLRGRTVTDISMMVQAGVLEGHWDGLDQSGELVAPGIYIIYIDLVTESGSTRAARTIAIGY
ncbi:MAG: hypothetical protein F4X17_01515 [Gemmatimonadetes bacterium]|nr:hypothetical protein [Gemmatimonadota bacterium]